MDTLTPEQRRYNMSRIHGKDTVPEMRISRLLWNSGYRYRLHRKDLPGKPDLVFTKYHAVIFVHGCFWHRHGCKYTSTPATRKEFWEAKFQGNISRDKRNINALLETSWRVLLVWECALRGKADDMESVLDQVTAFLHSDRPFYEIPAKDFPIGANSSPIAYAVQPPHQSLNDVS